MKPVALTDHARTAASERGLQLHWIERAACDPEWRAPDPAIDGRERRFHAIDERDGRVLRAVCEESDTEILVVTVSFDRRAKRPT